MHFLAGPLEIDPDVWLALLTLLRHCWQNMQSITTAELATLLSKLARGTPHSNIHSLVISWASEAATQFLTPTPDANGGQRAASSVIAQPSSISPAAPSPDSPEIGTAASTLCPDAFLEILMGMCRVAEPSTRHSAMQSLILLTHTGSSFAPHQLVASTSVACYSLTDPSELVSQAAIQLLVALSAPAMFSILSSAVQAAQRELPWRRLYALQPQQIAFQPEQLADLLDWLGQARPLVVSQPSKPSGPGAAGDEWLWTLLKACQPVGGQVTLPL